MKTSFAYELIQWFAVLGITIPENESPQGIALSKYLDDACRDEKSQKTKNARPEGNCSRYNDALDAGLTICARYPDSTLTDEEQTIKRKARAFFEAMKG